ncbi:MAG: YceI family protein [Chitinophagaceae bacterium]|nr:YceI family protein [Oligoflexus sp.]
MLKSRVLKLTALSFLVVPSIWAAPLKVSTGSVSFIATGKPGFLKINGTGADCHGTLDKDGKGITGEIGVPMEKFATGISMRDEHMKDKYFEVKKYPEATLKITKFETDANGDASKKPFTGKLNFHGIERDIEGTATTKTQNGKTTVDANFPLKLSDYNIDIPTYAGVKVADTVEVNANFEAETDAKAAALPVPIPAPAAAPAKITK